MSTIPVFQVSENLPASFLHQLMRPIAHRTFQSNFEDSLKIIAPIKISVEFVKNEKNSLIHPDNLAGCGLRYFRYLFGTEKVLCATVDIFKSDLIVIDVYLMLNPEDLQPWNLRESDIMLKNMNIKYELAANIKSINPYDLLDITGTSSSVPGNISSVNDTVLITVPQQWEREIESVNMNAVLPVESIWWKFLGGFQHPNILHSRIQNITVLGHLPSIQFTFTLQAHYVTAVTVLAVTVETSADAASLVSLLDGRVLAGYGRGTDKHLFPIKAFACNHLNDVVNYEPHMNKSLPAWLLDEERLLLMSKPPEIPASIFEVYNKPLPPHPPMDNEDGLVIFPDERWPSKIHPVKCDRNLRSNNAPMAMGDGLDLNAKLFKKQQVLSGGIVG
jgi:hypothetical protein